MSEVFVGLGSNVDPETHLREALSELTRALGVLRISRVYRSPAQGIDGPDFLNLVVGFDSSTGAGAVDDVLSSIEETGGREAWQRSGVRALDLDLLLYGARVDAAERLPREDVLEYAFVLAPLNDLAPDFRHPLTGVLIGDAWAVMAATNPRLTCLGPLESDE